MKTQDVKVGERYGCRVSGNRVTVRIERYSPSPLRGRPQWVATNERTGRRITIKSARRLTVRPEPLGPGAGWVIMEKERNALGYPVCIALDYYAIGPSAEILFARVDPLNPEPVWRRKVATSDGMVAAVATGQEATVTRVMGWGCRPVVRTRTLPEWPSERTLRDWTLGLTLDNPEAIDGCGNVEPDGACCHGAPAWPRAMGLI